MFEPKNYREVMCQRMRICVQRMMREKFEEELSCAMKNDMRNLANFVLTLESLKTCNLMSSFWAKYIIFELKNYIGVMCHDTEGWCNI